MLELAILRYLEFEIYHDFLTLTLRNRSLIIQLMTVNEWLVYL